ncbi:MAG: hypothetical protein ACRDPO_07160 [Streptosporangiaceae bacterium]
MLVTPRNQRIHDHGNTHNRHYRKGARMIYDLADLDKHTEGHDSNSLIDLPENAIFSYYRDEIEETGGMKVKWTIRIAQGAEAQRLDDRQNHAIRELLQWAARRQQPRRS